MAEEVVELPVKVRGGAARNIVQLPPKTEIGSMIRFDPKTQRPEIFVEYEAPILRGEVYIKSETPPPEPAYGDLWYDKIENRIKIFIP